MKRKHKIIVSTVLVLLVIIYIPDMYIDYQNSKINSIKLPAKYKSYITLDSLAITNKHITKHKSRYPEVIYPLSDSIIAFCIRIKDKTPIWYKLNTISGAKDSIYFKYKRIRFDNNFLFNDDKSNYYSWLIDGDTTKKKVVSLNIKREMSHEEIDNELENSDWTSKENFYIDGDRKEKIVFYKNNEWREIIIKEYYPLDTNFNYTIKLDPLDEMETRDSKFVYFQRDKISKSTFWSDQLNLGGFGNPNGGGRRLPSYYGQAYFNINTNGKLIKVKCSYAQLYEEGKNIHTNFKIYSTLKSKVVLIKHLDQTLYIIN